MLSTEGLPHRCLKMAWSQKQANCALVMICNICRTLLGSKRATFMASESLFGLEAACPGTYVTDKSTIAERTNGP